MSELRPILGGRIQRIDVVDVREIVLELRCPGRTLRLLISARPGFGRLHLVDRRPARLVPGGSLQELLRKRLIGRPLIGLEAAGAGVDLFVPGTRLGFRFTPRKDALEIEPTETPEDGESRLKTSEIPDHFPENEALAALYGARDQDERQSRLSEALLQPLRAQEKKLRRLLLRVQGDREKLEALRPNRHRAELLKSALGRIRRGADRVEVQDWLTGEPAILALDPSVEPTRQMELWFQKAKKAERGLPRVAERAEAVQAELDGLLARIERLEHADPETLEAGARDAEPTRGEPDPGRGRKEKPPSPIDRWARRFVSRDGAEIRVGKGASENDRLTFGAAKGTDVWLHARGVPGSHVLLRRGKGEPILQEALLDAAHLAVHFSDARAEASAEVIYTEARYVKKQKGAAPGLVSLSKEKTLWLRVEPERLQRLLNPEKK